MIERERDGVARAVRVRAGEHGGERGVEGRAAVGVQADLGLHAVPELAHVLLVDLPGDVRFARGHGEKHLVGQDVGVVVEVGDGENAVEGRADFRALELSSAALSALAVASTRAGVRRSRLHMPRRRLTSFCAASRWTLGTALRVGQAQVGVVGVLGGFERTRRGRADLLPGDGGLVIVARLRERALADLVGDGGEHLVLFDDGALRTADGAERFVQIPGVLRDEVQRGVGGDGDGAVHGGDGGAALGDVHVGRGRLRTLA